MLISDLKWAYYSANGGIGSGFPIQILEQISTHYKYHDVLYLVLHGNVFVLSCI